MLGQRLIGVVPLRQLILSRPDASLESIMQREPVAAHPGLDQEEVAALFSKYDLLSLRRDIKPPAQPNPEEKTTGVDKTSATHSQPAKRSGGTIASNATGVVSPTATISRRVSALSVSSSWWFPS